MSVLLFWNTENTEGTGSVLQAPSVFAQGSVSGAPLQSIIPSYLYQQYADDEDLQSFVDAYNTLAQSYLDWFNGTPLAVYTSANVSGPLLDWTAQGIYGFERPVFSSGVTRFTAGLSVFPLGTVALAGNEYFQSGTATLATDDFFKRVLTWWLYTGDGRHFNIPVLRSKVARFLYGANGTDIRLDDAQTVHIVAGPLTPPAAPTLSQIPGGTIAATTYAVRLSYLTAQGETLAGAGASLAVSSDYLIVIASPSPELGASDYNVYMGTLPSGGVTAGLASMALGTYPLGGTSNLAANLPTKQNSLPIAIGTDWSEPSTGIVHGAPLPSEDTSNADTNLIIGVPSSTAATFLQEALAQEVLSLPFQLSATVIAN